jgi:2-polyprenyl-6-methoxyphenol hydroxylase-like FAD-dependent oxidoreductase
MGGMPTRKQLHGFYFDGVLRPALGPGLDLALEDLLALAAEREAALVLAAAGLRAWAVRLRVPVDALRALTLGVLTPAFKASPATSLRAAAAMP